MTASRTQSIKPDAYKSSEMARSDEEAHRAGITIYVDWRPEEGGWVCDNCRDRECHTVWIDPTQPCPRGHPMEGVCRGKRQGCMSPHERCNMVFTKFFCYKHCKFRPEAGPQPVKDRGPPQHP